MLTRMRRSVTFDPQRAKEEVMATFVLVHGAWHGAWCWAKVAEALAGRGHRAVAFDLPGHGDDRTPLSQVTLHAYADRTVEALKEAGGRSVLLGHSMGGMVISQAAEAAPELVGLLVYLCAFLPRDGESLLDLESRNPAPAVPPALVISEDRISSTIPAEKLTPLFYHDCSYGDVAFATERLTPQALAPLAAPVTLTRERFGSVPRAYIECTEDGAISLDLQRDMQEKSPCALTASMAASHSPFLSQPEKLAGILIGFAESEGL
jgi:pimeloyl-ACP methyl ester carboxylesterase